MLELAHEVKYQNNRAAAVILCEELVDKFPWHGYFRENLYRRLKDNSNVVYEKAIWTRLVTKYPTQPLFLNSLLNVLERKSNTGTEQITVLFADHLCFQNHRGISVAPFDPWRDSHSKKPIAWLTIRSDLGCRSLYSAVAGARNVSANHIQLWVIRDEPNETSRESAKVITRVSYEGVGTCKDLLSDFKFTERNRNCLWLYVEEYKDLPRVVKSEHTSMYVGIPVNDWPRPQIWTVSEVFVFIFLKQFNAHRNVLRGVRPFYVKKYSGVSSLTFEINKMMGWNQGSEDVMRATTTSFELILFKETPFGKLDMSRTFAENSVTDGDIVWFWRAPLPSRLPISVPKY